MWKISAYPFIVLCLVAFCGCDANREVEKPAQNIAENAPLTGTPGTSLLKRLGPLVQFSDITSAAGIRFKHHNGAFGAKLMPETLGSGVAFIDYNNDGWQDIFFVNSRDWTEAEVNQYRFGNWNAVETADYIKQYGTAKQKIRKVPTKRSPARTYGALYQNNGDGTFRDVTIETGLDVTMYGMGASVGDYDNDGLSDLYVTAYPRNYLFHNEGRRFREVAIEVGLKDSGWSTSAAWVDYDLDGRLDLFVCHYVDWTPGTDVYAGYAGKKVYVGPRFYQGVVNYLYRNMGQKGFKDVSQQAGIQANSPRKAKQKARLGKALGVAILDYNNDSQPDIVVANDSVPNFLFKNNGNGSFTEVGVESGIAYGPNGDARAGMGIDIGDVDQSGRDSIVIGNFALESLGLYHNTGMGNFIDVAPRTGIAARTFVFLTFGCTFIDVDNNGWLDIFMANGNIAGGPPYTGGHVTHAQQSLLFYNEGDGNFTEISRQTGSPLVRPIVGRGLAYADFDLDGDLDVVLTVNDSKPLLLLNSGGNRNHSIRMTLQGAKSNRSAIGTVVEARVGTEIVRRTVRSGSSYLSQSELPLTIGLGSNKVAEVITIRWPSGKVTTLQNVTAGQRIIVDEQRGVVSRANLKRTPPTRVGRD
jgi:hypothetical protein